MRVAFAIVTAALAAGCSQSGEAGFGVAVTATFSPLVTDDTLSKVTSLEIVASLDEMFSKTVELGRAAHRTERFIYRPGATTFQLDLFIEALDQNQALVADGRTGTLTLTPGQVIEEAITLTPPGASDLGAPDLTVVDEAVKTDAAQKVETDGGPISFVAAAITPTAANPVDVVAKDLNGDGLADVTVACKAGGKIQTFFTQKDGTLPATPSFETTTLVAPSSLVAVAATSSSAIVALDSHDGGLYGIKTDGKGTITLGPRTVTFAGADSIATADFDKDGYNDLVVASSTVASIQVQYATGTVRTYTTSAPVSRVHTADVDGDGYLDIVLAETNVEVWRNTQKTTTQTFAALPVFATSVPPTEVLVFDIDGDGDNDIYALHGDDGTGTVTVFTNNNGTYAASDGYYSPGQTNSDYHAVVLDLDGDSHPDILATAGNAPDGNVQGLVVALWKDNQPPDYSQSPNNSAFAFEEGVGAFAVADIDGDGRLDLVAVDQVNNNVAVARGWKAPGQFDAASIVSGGSGNVVIHFGDGDGDGLTDIIVAAGSLVAITLNDGSGQFPNVDFVTPPNGVNINAAAVADLDGNGHPDVVCVTDKGKLGVAFGQGSGTFSTPTFTSYGTTFVDVVLSDVNRDGKLDAIMLDSSTTANTSAKNIVVVLGDGKGGFSTPSTYAAIDPVQLLLGDVDGDKHDDVVVLSSNSQLSVYLDATSGLSTSVIHTTSAATHTTAMALLNADTDGHLDLVVSGDTVHVMVGSGSGAFTDRGAIYSTLSTGVAAGNVDGRGNDDVIVSTDHSIIVLPDAIASSGIEFPAGAQVVQLVGGVLMENGLLDVIALGNSGVLLLNQTE